MPGLFTVTAIMVLLFHRSQSTCSAQLVARFSREAGVIGVKLPLVVCPQMGALDVPFGADLGRSGERRTRSP
jgi:hypothetical protein